jgi:predicted acetyltransferase
VITLTVPPRLVPPTAAVRISYLTGEQADKRHRGEDTGWLAAASEDFDGFVADRTGVRERWGVPSTLLWFVSGPHYLGTLVIRHRLLHDGVGGHIGYHVVLPWQHQGHAGRMLAEGRLRAARLGIDRALLTVAPENAWSRRVVLANGGEPDGRNVEGEDRFWLPPVS